jgi:hypothetical protein
MPGSNSAKFFEHIGTLVKHPVLSLVLTFAGVVAGYSVNVATTKQNTADIKELKAAQQDFLRKSDFRYDLEYIKTELELIRQTQNQQHDDMSKMSQRIDAALMRKH